MTRARVLCLTALVLIAAARAAGAQELRPAVFGSVAVAHIYRAEDRGFGTELNLGGGVGVEWKRLGFDGEVHRTLGLAPREVTCGVLGVPCSGSAREGLLAATMLSGNVSVYVGTRVRPYVIGSVGVLWTDAVNSLTVVSHTAATLSEFSEQDAGLALGVGVGVDVPLGAALSIRPEFRTYSSVALSRANLGMHRATIGVRYRW